MYLSRIQLNPRRREARWLLSSPQRLHAAVLQSFPDPPTGDLGGGSRVLWRLDSDATKVFLYVVSPEQADLLHIAEQAGWPSTERGVSKPYGPFLDRLEVGQQWAFRLTANPTRYVTSPTDGRTRRLGHVTVKQQEAWLLDKAQGGGFRVTSTVHQTVDGETAPDIAELAVTQRTVHSFSRRDPDAPARKEPVTIATAQFDGRLEVTDADALRRSLVAGIGPAKAYGCGLLTLARVDEV